MPYYYCETCQKVLERHEQRHNREQVSSQRAMIIGQLNNIPGHPLIGIPLNNNQTINVVRCVKCGSDAVLCYTKEEQEAAQQKRIRDNSFNRTECLIIVFGVIIFFLIMWALLHA